MSRLTARPRHLLLGIPLLLLSMVAQARPGGSAPFDASVDLGNGKAYFFKDGEYVRFDIGSDRADPGFPQPTAPKWPGLWDGSGLDAAFNAGNGKAYFFKGGEYIRWNIAGDRADPGFPKPIAGNWPGVWEGDFEAALGNGRGKAYFFKGAEYIRYDIGGDRADPGFPKPIAEGWRGLWDGGGIDAAFNAGNGKAYFFKGGEYVRWDLAADRADPGFPKPIAGNWRGVWGHEAASAPEFDVPGLLDVLLPTGNPVAGLCPAEYITYRSGECSPKPPQKNCLKQLVERVRAQNLMSVPTAKLTLEQARDVVIALYDEKKISFPAKQGFEPVFDSKTCAVTSPTQLANPKMTALSPPPFKDAMKVPSRRLAITGTVAGVSLRYLGTATDQRTAAARAGSPKNISNLEVRMVVGLYRLADFLKTKYGVTSVFHSGITSAEGHHYESGRTIDFIGACGGSLGECGDANTEAEGLFVGDDWGHQPVPADKASSNDPNFWSETVKDPTYRLDLPGADAKARGFFQALYGFFMSDYQAKAARLGQASFILTPDDGDPKQRRGGKDGHREHVHAELPAPPK